jgi:hypothetical protein
MYNTTINLDHFHIYIEKWSRSPLHVGLLFKKKKKKKVKDLSIIRLTHIPVKH